jgi:hypothetical protein
MGRKGNPKGAVSASALSQMGVCERLVVFEHREGKRPSPDQKAALQRGLRAHRTFAAEGTSAGASDEHRAGRCFVATHVFGEGPETEVLRRFRDRVLRPWPAGRRLIIVYCRLAPTVCRAMKRWPVTCIAARWAMRPVVWIVRHLVARETASHGD